jgi:hypothetical protein
MTNYPVGGDEIDDLQREGHILSEAALILAIIAVPPVSAARGSHSMLRVKQTGEEGKFQNKLHFKRISCWPLRDPVSHDTSKTMA